MKNESGISLKSLLFNLFEILQAVGTYQRTSLACRFRCYSPLQRRFMPPAMIYIALQMRPIYAGKVRGERLCQNTCANRQFAVQIDKIRYLLVILLKYFSLG